MGRAAPRRRQADRTVIVLVTGASGFLGRAVAGELIAVRPESREWEGAAERVMRGFALSLLVDQRSYPQVAAWIDRNHLGTRLVYFQVPDSVVPRPAKHLQIKRRALRIILVSAFKPGITSVSPEGRGETEINDITLNQQAK